MFAMLHGPLSHALDGSAAEAVRAQVEAGLELVTDGGAWLGRTPASTLLAEPDAAGRLVDAWRATASLPEAAGTTVAATMPGPYTLARATDDTAAAIDIARRLAPELVALQAAGCPMVVVDEPDAVHVGADPAERARFREAHDALLAGAPGLHAMLAITGGSAWGAGPETILAAPYRSYLFDLVAGPDNWYLVRATPGDRGIVCAALRVPFTDDQASVLVWAAHYAASANGRGLDRVGLANASSLANASRADAEAALRGLAGAARFATMEPGAAVEAGLDRRTFAQPAGRGARPRRLG